MSSDVLTIFIFVFITSGGLVIMYKHPNWWYRNSERRSRAKKRR